MGLVNSTISPSAFVPEGAMTELGVNESTRQHLGIFDTTMLTMQLASSMFQVNVTS